MDVSRLLYLISATSYCLLRGRLNTVLHHFQHLPYLGGETLASLGSGFSVYTVNYMIRCLLLMIVLGTSQFH